MSEIVRVGGSEAVVNPLLEGFRMGEAVSTYSMLFGNREHLIQVSILPITVEYPD